MIDLLVVALAYALGAINGAYYAVRLVAGRDVRAIGTGTAGARNSAKVLGTAGGVGVFLWDFGKAALAVGLAMLVGAGSWAIAGAAVAAVVGHIWPVQLGFRGGKGIACAFGGLVVLNFFVAIGIALAFLPVYAILRRFTISGLIGFGAGPLIALGLAGVGPVAAATLALALLVIVAHRRDIAQYVSERQGVRT